MSYTGVWTNCRWWRDVALASLWFGDVDDVGNVMYVKADTGVGAEQLLTGPQGMVGEIGHIPVVLDGHPCRWG